MSALVRLYPRAWRERYEAEFLELLEARPPTIGDRFDILRGALDARLHPQVRRLAGSTMRCPISPPMSRNVDEISTGIAPDPSRYGA